VEKIMPASPSFYYRFLLLSCAFALPGCIPAVLGTSAAAGLNIAEERTMGSAVDDATIWTRIKNDLLQKDINNLFAHVGITVTEGRVLVTGYVADPQMRLEVIKIAWKQRGVKEVINELRVEVPTGQTAVKDYSKDAWITTQLKSKLLFNAAVRSVNYSVETIEGTVYLIGIAQDKDELDLVTNIAGTIKYVQKVVSYVRLKNAPLRKTT
jgi:osmotically-inducible protein OsmY